MSVQNRADIMSNRPPAKPGAHRQGSDVSRGDQMAAYSLYQRDPEGFIARRKNILNLFDQRFGASATGTPGTSTPSGGTNTSSYITEADRRKRSLLGG